MTEVKDLKQQIEKLEKAIQLSVTKYCSVITSIRSDIPLTYECEVVE